MDVNSLKINLGLLEQSIEAAEANKTVYRTSVIHLLSMVEDERIELGHFLAEVDDVVAKARDVCQV